VFKPVDHFQTHVDADELAPASRKLQGTDGPQGTQQRSNAHLHDDGSVESLDTSQNRAGNIAVSGTSSVALPNVHNNRVADSKFSEDFRPQDKPREPDDRDRREHRNPFINLASRTGEHDGLTPKPQADEHKQTSGSPANVARNGESSRGTRSLTQSKEQVPSDAAGLAIATNESLRHGAKLTACCYMEVEARLMQLNSCGVQDLDVVKTELTDHLSRMKDSLK